MSTRTTRHAKGPETNLDHVSRPVVGRSAWSRVSFAAELDESHGRRSRTAVGSLRAVRHVLVSGRLRQPMPLPACSSAPLVLG